MDVSPPLPIVTPSPGTTIADPPAPPVAASRPSPAVWPVPPVGQFVEPPPGEMTATAPVRVGDARQLGSEMVKVARWPDGVLDRFGHDPRSTYAERFWLPILGPGTVCLLRNLAGRFDDEPDGFDLDLRDVSRALGLGSNHAPSPAFYRTVDRVVSFGFAQLVESRLVMVRTHLPPLTRRQVQRLPRRLQREHDEIVEQQRDHTQPEQMRRRARALALSLFDLGEDHEGTERQLHRWKFHPALAHDAVRWAAAEHRRRAAAEGAPEALLDAALPSGTGDAA